MPRARSLFVLIALATTIAAGPAEAGTAKQTQVASSAAAPQLALQRALAVLAPARFDARYRSAVASVDPRQTTLILRDLVAAKPKLTGADRRRAEALLARPTDGQAFEGPAGYGPSALASKKRYCNGRFCIHWVRVGSERPSLRNVNPNNNRPDYVDKTIANMNSVWNKEIGALNYKRPLADWRSGGHHGGNPNGRIDIFIANIGNQGLYGYCTTDDPRARPNGHRQNSAYCVIDDDFRRAEFPSPSANGNAANKVTLAHEFFHAVQFAYDTFDKAAVMEGTATWMEDEVFDSVNDNRQYLETSPLGEFPWAPLDLFANSGLFANWQYGTWIFYRFLSENLGFGIVRQIWKQAVGPTRQGFRAIAPALVDRNTSLLEQMTIFGEWNSAPATDHYHEGASYPTATPNTAPGGVGGPLGPSGTDSVAIEMLSRSNDYVRYDPVGTSSGSTLDFSNVAIPGGAATDVTAYAFAPGGSILDVEQVADGGSIAFDLANVDKVVVVLTNSGGSNFFDPNTWDFDVTVNP